MTAPTIHLAARLVPDVDQHAADLPGSWFITHGLGGPAAGTYTEVAFAPEATGLRSDDRPMLGEAVLEAAVIQTAQELYGRQYAFVYRPEQAEASVHRHGLRRRERVVITELEVWA